MSLPESDSRLMFKYKPQKCSFWRVGRVFQFPWSETAGTTAFQTNPRKDEFILGRHNGTYIYQKNRIFVVIQEGHNSCGVLAINTYGGQGVAKPSVDKSQHGVIHTGKDDVVITQAEADRPGLLQEYSIRVVNDRPTSTLDSMSRINYGQVHTIQHNSQVESIGMVHEASIPHLIEQFVGVWVSSIRLDMTAGQPRPRASSVVSDFANPNQTPPGPANYAAAPSFGHQPSPPGLLAAHQYHQPRFLPHPVSYEAIQSTAAQSQRAIGDGSPQLHSYSYSTNAGLIARPRRTSYGRRRRAGPYNQHHPTSRYGG